METVINISDTTDTFKRRFDKFRMIGIYCTITRLS